MKRLLLAALVSLGGINAAQAQSAPPLGHTATNGAGQPVIGEADLMEALRLKLDAARFGQPGGVAPLDGGGRVPLAYLPSVIVAQQGQPANNLADLLAGVTPLTGQRLAGSPVIPTCPVSNCPTPDGPGFGNAFGGPILSASWTYGRSTSAPQPQFFAQDGFYVEHGGDTAGRGQYVGRYVGAMQGPNAGPTWALNTDIVRGACAGGPNSLYGQPGSGIPFGSPGCSAAPGSLGRNSTIGYELDLSNFDADSATSGAFVTGLYIQTLSRFSGGGGISFGNSTGADLPASWHHGIEFAPRTASDAVIYDLSSAQIGWLARGIHASALIQDEATGAASIVVSGTKTTADFQSLTNSPAVLSMSGQHSFAAIYDGSTAPMALTADGTYAVAAVNVRGTAPAAVVASGNFSIAAFTSVGAQTAVALQAAPNQQVCMAGIYACAFYSPATHRWYFTDGNNVVVASIPDGGDMRIRGTLYQGVTP